MAAMALHASAPPPVVVVWMKGLGYIMHCQISSVEQKALIDITHRQRFGCCQDIWDDIQ
jgi:hypothetical protein